MRTLSAVLVGLAVLAACASEGQTPSASSEDQVLQLGRRVFQNYCATCHQPNGQGVPGIYPPLTPNEWIQGDKGRLIRLVLHGAQGEMKVGGEVYNNVMTAHDFLTDEQIAAVLTFIRQNFGNQADPVTPEEVAAVRATSRQQGPWDPAVLWEQTGIPQAGD
ncbi:cytochrome c class I [Rhodothermus marinus SG0.5JP17-172]|uniref:c-type cytochrome n=1 Tax=Rhodothermus marinus TaxID=29549 RepID=UPI000223D7C6|nr:cytochrome c [Rhodothermus marinus]AEN73348.1 cytochrome c class I [Rhodothermus marinus SG0.5JP17-172]MBO2492106.1 cytochrome c [Rhodothermus marinus]